MGERGGGGAIFGSFRGSGCRERTRFSVEVLCPLCWYFRLSRGIGKILHDPKYFMPWELLYESMRHAGFLVSLVVLVF